MPDHPYDLERLGAVAAVLSSRCGEYLSRMAPDGSMPPDTVELLLSVQALLIQVSAALSVPAEVPQ